MDYKELNSLISHLESMVSAQSFFGGNRNDWRPHWDLIKRIGPSFKETRYPQKEDKNDAYQKFQNLVARIKEYQNREREQFQEKIRQSESYKNIILSYVSKGTPPSWLEGIVDALVLAPIENIVEAALSWLPGEYDQEKEALQYCSSMLKEAGHLLSQYKEKMLGRDKKECFEAIQRAQESLDSAWKAYKAARQKAFDSWKASKEAKHRQWEEKQRAFKEKLQESISYNESKLERLYDVLQHKESNLDNLHDKINSARSDEFRDVVQGWIDREHDSIREISNKIEQVKDKLYDMRSKL